MSERVSEIVGPLHERQQIPFRSEFRHVGEEVFQMAEFTIHRALNEAFCFSGIGRRTPAPSPI